MNPITSSIPPGPISVAVIGLGKAGCWHLERFGLRGDFTVVAGCDECPDSARRAAGLAPRIVMDHRELLGDSRTELVVIATPPATHAALALEALAAGRHVLLETPAALSRFEIDAIRDAQRRSGKSVIVAQTQRWDAEFWMARDCLAVGEIGSPCEIKFIHWQYRPRRTPKFESVERDTSDLTTPGKPWRDETARGGGALWEFGTHLFDQLLILAQHSPHEQIPVSVFARLKSDTDDSEVGFQAMIRFSAGLEAHIEVDCGVAAPLETGWVIAASRGSYARQTQFTVTDDGEIVDVPRLPGNASDVDFQTAVARHLRASAPNPTPIENARRVILLIEAARKSARCGQPVAVEE